MTDRPNGERVDIVDVLLDPAHCDEARRRAAEEIQNQRERVRIWIKSSEGWKYRLGQCEDKLAAKSREVERLRALVDALSDEADGQDDD